MIHFAPFVLYIEVNTIKMHLVIASWIVPIFILEPEGSSVIHFSLVPLSSNLVFFLKINTFENQTSTDTTKGAA